jgi:hypothetical protein
MHTKFLLENLKARDLISVDERLILKFFLKTYCGRLFTDFIWLRIGSSGGSCKHDDKLLVPIKYGESLKWFMNLKIFLAHMTLHEGRNRFPHYFQLQILAHADITALKCQC